MRALKRNLVDAFKHFATDVAQEEPFATKAMIL